MLKLICDIMKLHKNTSLVITHSAETMLTYILCAARWNMWINVLQMVNFCCSILI